ncbi:hypothetical protein, partial [Micromonospora carbonacea]
LPDPGLVWLSTLRRDRSDQAQLHAAVAEFYSRGLGEVDWAGVHTGKGHRTTTIPTYPFERRTYWVPSGRGESMIAATSRPASLREETRKPKIHLYPPAEGISVVKDRMQ